MNTATPAPMPSGGFAGRLHQTEAWLDRKGKFAWIAATVLAFVVFWPLGLALLAYLIWSKRMFKRTQCGTRSSRSMRHEWTQSHPRAYSSSGNTSFDSYKADALRRLEEEQEAFEAFIQRLRDAKDKAQFDSFMDDRARANRETPVDVTAAATTTTPQAPEADSRGGAY